MAVNNLKTGSNGLQLVKGSEGCRLEAYQDVKGIWTIGWGHVGPESTKGSVVTQEQADAFLVKDLQWVEDTINGNVTVILNQNQFDALVSLVFNIGPGSAKHPAFIQSTLLRMVNSDQFGSAALQFLRWNKANGVPVEGLTRRRRAEMALFTTPVLAA